MQRHAEAFTQLLGRNVTVEGVTDLAVDGLKFSGNAQRRRRQWLLFHGTVLYDFDLDLIGQVLRLPPRQPEYRRGRAHREFITQLPVSRSAIQRALCEAWKVEVSPVEVELPSAAIAQLVTAKYANDSWTLRPSPSRA
jgi:lipoate-protein ligase A